MAIILNVGIVLIPFQSKVILRSTYNLFTRDILVKPVEPGQGAIVLSSWEADFWDGIE